MTYNIRMPKLVCLVLLGGVRATIEKQQVRVTVDRKVLLDKAMIE